MLTVVMRYGSAKRQRFGFPSMVSEVLNESANGEPADQSMEQDEVEAMVSGVKSHGVSLVIRILVAGQPSTDINLVRLDDIGTGFVEVRQGLVGMIRLLSSLFNGLLVV